MTTFLVTGAGGYIAGRLMERLISREFCERLVGTDVKPTAPRDDIVYHGVDIRSPETTRIIADEKPDVVVHMAFAVDFLHDTSEERSVNIGGLERVLAGVEAAGTCRQLVVTSSAVVVGAYEGISLFQDEEDPVCIHPHLPYARDKVITEKICRDFQPRIPDTNICLIRPEIVIGPHWANFWAAAFFLLPVLPRIDGRDTLFQFIHEDDLAQLYMLAIEKEAAGAFNAGADGALSLREIAKMVGRPTMYVHSSVAKALVWLMHHLRLIPLGSPPAIIDFFSYPWTVSNQKARDELGFEPRYSSREAFEQVLTMRSEILENLGRTARGGYRLFNAVLNTELRRLAWKSRRSRK